MTTQMILIIVGVAVLLLALLFLTSYVKAPTDKVYIITGGGRPPKYLRGKAGLKIPFFQRLDKLSVQMLSVDVKTSQTIPTLDYINIDVDSVAVVKIGTTDALLAKASENFLNKDTAYINKMVVNVLEGNLREIIGSMNLRDIMNDRKTFAAKVQENAMADMQNMGLQIVTFNIQNIDDAGLGVIENLGIANTVAIRKDAEISKANAQKEIAVAQADANMAANAAEVASETAIAERDNELALKKAALQAQADTEKAKANAAGQIETQRQQKAINTEQVNADIARSEREAELKQKEVAVKEQELAASVKKQAEADKYAAQMKAEADLVRRQKEAEAQKYEQEKEAEAQKAKAEAARYSAEQEAAGVRAKGEAEAAAIQAKGEAEAEAMKKKAEAYKLYNGAAMAEMMIKIMPEMAKAIAEPISAIDKINIYGGSNGSDCNGASQISGITPAVIKQVFDTMSDVTGVNLSDIMKANTYDAKVNKNINVTGISGVDVKVDSEAVNPASDIVE